MAEVTVRVLRDDHREALARFLGSRPDSHLFLRANLADGRLEDDGQRGGGTWVGTVRDDGTVTSVAALLWNGICLLQMPEHGHDILDMLAGAAAREMIELAGPTAQVEVALTHGLARERVLKSRHDGTVMDLTLADLVVPAALESRTVDFRPSTGQELGQLGDWHAAFNDEVFGDGRSPDSELKARQWIRAVYNERRGGVATVDDQPVAYAAITGRVEGDVNVGAVYTPPDARGRGYARCAVAGLLFEAARDGAMRACLTVQNDNAAARRSYAALGFHPAFDWTITRYFPA
ncbi:MAG TPA: GNAT family N-acetyltransferase [Vineibacter sp.]|nr:GNAT family N-acetyltransferase [Vineibacter sp.]